MSYIPTPAQRAAMSRTLKERTYKRTPEHNALMSKVKTGVPKPKGWKPPSTQPEVASKIAAWWTPERREAKRLEMMVPNTTYYGLTTRDRTMIKRAAGKCARCGTTKRLDVHHKDRNKQNQKPSNLEVLCRRCHFQEHRHEIGWAVYWRKRNKAK